MRRFDSRLRRLEKQFEEEDGPRGPGLAALLEWARKQPRQSWDEDDEDEKTSTCFTELLKEAREWVAREREERMG